MAKPFRFVLEPLLDQAQRAEDACRAQFAAAKKACDDASAELSKLRGLLNAYSGGGSHVHFAYVDSLAAAIAEHQRLTAATAAEEETARARLHAAHKGKKVLQTIKSRRYAAHVAARTAREEREFDESNARR